MKIALIPGSLRAGSYNRKLIAVAEGLLNAHGVSTDLLDLKKFPVPPYDGDLEAMSGLPETVINLKSRIAEASAVVISSPEYSGGIPGMLKNVLDWTSRGGKSPWVGKVVLLMGVSDGPWGTNRMLPAFRHSMSIMGAFVLPQTVTIPYAGKVWSDDGTLLDDTLPPRVDKVLERLLEFTKKMTG
ncbi:NAD(P)H-dependent oxidoreductase [bacterium]|nr:NAD(P)H-dependent oxidoreductase [bacterium]